MVWTGRIISTLIILFMLVDGAAKVARWTPYVEGTVKAGFADSLVVPLGIVALACTIFFAIPQTSILGAILMTGYFGGATATHVRLGQPWYFPVVFGILVWVSMYLREPRLRALVPLRSKTTATVVTVLIAMALPLTARADTVAVVSGKPITAAEIDKRAATSLLRLRQQEYDIKSKAAKDIAIDRLMASEAARDGITVEALNTREVDAKVAQPVEDEINLMLRVLAARLSRDPAEARKQVIESLRAQKVAERTLQYRAELLEHAKFEMRMTPPRASIAIAATDPVRVESAAPVTLVEFSDFQCPYCGRSQQTLHELQKQYARGVRLVFKQFPLQQIHENARMAAEASLCARDQGKFWQMHDWMFENPGKLSRDAVVAAAPSLGIDAAPLGKCMDEHLHAGDIDRDLALGEQIGVNGTPSFYINGRLLTSGNSLDNFREVINEELRTAVRR
jgi:protein-disulfide isomerase